MILMIEFGVPTGIRTPVTAVKGDGTILKI